MALVVFLQEDEDVPSVYRNLKIFCETAPWVFYFYYICLIQFVIYEMIDVILLKYFLVLMVKYQDTFHNQN